MNQTEAYNRQKDLAEYYRLTWQIEEWERQVMQLRDFDIPNAKLQREDLESAALDAVVHGGN